jgi:predicted RNA-binding protein with PUA-like domain
VATNRPTMRQLNDLKTKERLAEMELAIAEGRLTVRQMTPRERREADAHRATRASARTARASARR